jgi:hypothetical protein
MSLAMPGQGVQALTLGFNLDCFQMQALDELGWNTVSPSNGGNAAPGHITPRKSGHAAAGRITPRESGHTTPWEIGSAITPRVGINPPNLPGNDVLLQGATAGVNLRIRLLDATTTCQQSLIAAGSIGNSVVFSTGNRTRNSDQVNVLHLVNQQMAEGMAHLNSMVPSQDKHCMAQLEGATASALHHMAQYQYNALGMDTSTMFHHIAALENKLNGLLDSIFIV